MIDGIITSLVAAAIFWMIPYVYKLIFCHFIFYKRYRKRILWLNYCLKPYNKSISGKFNINQELIDVIKNIEATSENEVKVTFNEFLKSLKSILSYIEGIQKKRELTYLFSKYFYRKEDQLKKLISMLEIPDTIQVKNNICNLYIDFKDPIKLI